MDMYPVTWSAGDTGPGDTCRITAFGKTAAGEAACVHIAFTPFFYVAGPAGWGAVQCRPLLAEWAKRFGALLEKSRVVNRQSIWGFRGSGAQEQPFVQLVFPSLASFRRARYALARQYDTFEGGVDQVIRLFHLRGLGPSRWMHVRQYRQPARLLADVDIEIECVFTDVSASSRPDRPPLVFASYDIEARSATDKFPVADNPDDNLIQISTAFQRYGEPEPFARTVVCLRETAPVDGVDIWWSDREEEVIERWALLLREHKADVLLGYNIWQFDWRYISGRCGVLADDDTGEPLVNTELLGRLVEGGGEVREYELSSAAYGQNKFFLLQTPGVQQLDLLQYIRREHKLPQYSLDAVSKHFLGSQKLDLPAAEIFRKYLGSAEDRADIARYAVRDTELPLKLLGKLCIWENLVEMANAVNVPLDYLLTRGQQVRAHRAGLSGAPFLVVCRRVPCLRLSRCAGESHERRPGQGARDGLCASGQQGHRHGGGQEV